MGASSSKKQQQQKQQQQQRQQQQQQQQQPTSDQPQSSGGRRGGGSPPYTPPGTGHMGETFFASDETRTAFGEEPHITLANESNYTVSFWVVQEDKKRITARRKYIANAMDAKANVGIAGGGLSAGFESETKETVETKEVGEFFMRDHRKGPKGVTGPTHLFFPAKCKDIRVFGFIERGGEWHAYMEKVYSIGRPIGRLSNKTKFKLTALDSNTESYSGLAHPDPEKGQDQHRRVATNVHSSDTEHMKGRERSPDSMSSLEPQMEPVRKTDITISDLPAGEKAVLVSEFDVSENETFVCSEPFVVRLHVPGEGPSRNVGPVLVSSTQEWVSLEGVDFIVTDVVECLPHGEKFDAPLQLEIELDYSTETSDISQSGYETHHYDSSGDDIESRSTCTAESDPVSLGDDDLPSSDGFTVVYRATPGSAWEKVAPEQVECFVCEERSFVRVQLEHFSATAIAYGKDLNGKSMKHKITFARKLNDGSATPDTRDLMLVILPYVRKEHFLKQLKATVEAKIAGTGGKLSLSFDRDLAQHHFITPVLPISFCLNAGDTPQEYYLDDSARGVFCIICGISLPKTNCLRLLCVLRSEYVRARKVVEITMGSVHEPALYGSQQIEPTESMAQVAMRQVLGLAAPFLGAAGSGPSRDA